MRAGPTLVKGRPSDGVPSELKVVVEPGGAVALAALLAGKVETRNRVTVAVLSGGNVDPELFSQLVA